LRDPAVSRPQGRLVYLLVDHPWNTEWGLGGISKGIGDLYRIFTISQRDGLDYILACIPATFNAPKKETFEPEYMGRLFDMGFEMAANGYPWQKLPPGYDPIYHHYCWPKPSYLNYTSNSNQQLPSRPKLNYFQLKFLAI
jgi:hypothetical protein